MRNTILTALAVMLLPLSASAQFYTITKGTDFNPISIENMSKTADNKEEAKCLEEKENVKDTIVSLAEVQSGNGRNIRNGNKSTSLRTARQQSVRKLPELTIPNLYEEIKRNGIRHPKIVLAQAILETGWFRSLLCRDRHNLFGLTNPKTGKYFEFGHWTESVRAYYTKVQYKYYQKDKKIKSDVDYLIWLRDLPYALDRNYIKYILSVMKNL